MERLDTEQVTKAVTALKQFLKKKRSENSKQSLVEENEIIQMIIARNNIPARGQIKSVAIPLPHNIRGDGEACLIVKDSDKARIKNLLKADPVPGLTKVRTLKKLEKHFSQFKDKRELRDAYGVFLADDRIMPYLKSILGKTFLKCKKQPIIVRVSNTQNISEHIRQVLNGTEMYVSPGPCFNVKISHDGMKTEEIVENIMEGTKRIIANVPKKWKNIKSINIKTSTSVALPIYNALQDSIKLPSNSNKRKAEEESNEPASKKVKSEDEKDANSKGEMKNDVTKASPLLKKAAADAKKAAANAKKAAANAKKSPTKANITEETVAETKEVVAPTKKESTPTKNDATPTKKEEAASVKKGTSPAKKSTPAKKVPVATKAATTTKKMRTKKGSASKQ